MTMIQVTKKRLLPRQKLEPTATADIQKFTASLNFARNAIVHNRLRLMALWSEAGSVDSAAIPQDMESLRQKFASYELKLI